MTVARQGSVFSPKLKVIGQEEKVSSCTRGSLYWILGKNFFMEKAVSKVPEKLVELPSLEIFKRFVRVAHKFNGENSVAELTAGLNSLSSLFQT